jgi:hypothetical protein
MPRDFFILWMSLFLIGGTTVLLLPLVRALAERIRPRPGALDPGLREELQLLREDILEELQQARREIGDLGERVDFTERLLAKKTER